MSDELGRKRKAAVALKSTMVSRIYSSYSKVRHSLTDNLHLFKVTVRGPIPVAAQSKAWVCGRSLAGVVSSNPARGINDCLLRMLCVAGRSPCDWNITRPEESYRVWS